MKPNKKHRLKYCIFCIFALLFISLSIFMYYGGFHTGKSVDVNQFKKYAEDISEISIPKHVKIVALGEATHGNKEFQHLKLVLFQQLVEKNGVKAFAIEGDFGGSQKVNAYIHGENISIYDAISAIGFQIYQTNEIKELLLYMREYNRYAKEGEDLRFYGYDMQRYQESFAKLLQQALKHGINTKEFKQLMKDGEWDDKYDIATRKRIIIKVQEECKKNSNMQEAVQLAEVLLQYLKLQEIQDSNDAMNLRDTFMAQNVEWILAQEEKLFSETIFITGHNTHVGKWKSVDTMGKLLQDLFFNEYFVIGTDFYKTNCNVPNASKRRTNQIFYSHNPLAKAAKKANLDSCYLDFSKISKEATLYQQVNDYLFMGNLGEHYSIFMRLLPPSYRIFQPPAQLYDAMIIVVDATPITIYKEGELE